MGNGDSATLILSTPESSLQEWSLICWQYSHRWQKYISLHTDYTGTDPLGIIVVKWVQICQTEVMMEICSNGIIRATHEKRLELH